MSGLTTTSTMPVQIIRDVPATAWNAFLARFSRVHRTWRATIHGVERGALVTRVPSAAIESLSLERHIPDPIVRLTFVGGVSLCAAGPCAIRVQQDEDGRESALEIETVGGAFLRLAFRATVLPEELDGIAPGEVADDVSSLR